MSVNKARGDMYEDIDMTWNPISGRCSNLCTYCYMKRIWNMMGDDTLQLKESYFNDNLGKGNRIFVGSSTDMFAENVPSGDIEQVLKHLSNNFPDNEYLFQSKNPERFWEFRWKLKGLVYNNTLDVTLGTTIETNRDYKVSMAPNVEDRSIAIRRFSTCGWKTQVTIEPVMDFDFPEFVDVIRQARTAIVYIGADSKNSKLPSPNSSKIYNLICELAMFTQVKLKKNLIRLLNANQVYELTKKLDTTIADLSFVRVEKSAQLKLF